MEIGTVIPLHPPTHLFLTSRCHTHICDASEAPVTIAETCQDIDTVFNYSTINHTATVALL